MKIRLLLLLACLTMAAVMATFADDAIDHEIALLKTDVQKDKVDLISANMRFTPDEAGKFWPIYKQYDAELSKIRDERIAMIKDYAQNFNALTNEKAKELTDRWFKTENARLALKKKYVGQLNKVLPATTVARFLQVENQLNMLLDLQIADSIPLVNK